MPETAGTPLTVYVCSPYRADSPDRLALNVKRAQRMCLRAFELGHVPIAPHLMYPGVLNDCVPAERQAGLEAALHLLERCDEVWVLRVAPSQGMQGELERAVELGLPIRSVTLEEIEPRPAGIPDAVRCPGCKTAVHVKFTVQVSPDARLCLPCNALRKENLTHAQ